MSRLPFVAGEHAVRPYKTCPAQAFAIILVGARRASPVQRADDNDMAIR